MIAYINASAEIYKTSTEAKVLKDTYCTADGTAQPYIKQNMRIERWASDSQAEKWETRTQDELMQDEMQNSTPRFIRLTIS